jgi:hypothetical protein
MGWIERIFFIGVGIAFTAGSCQKVIYMRRGLSNRPPTHIATVFGRACFFLLGITLVFVGLTGITEFWYFRR